MPDYQYLCKSCQHVTDVKGSMHEEMPIHLHCLCGAQMQRMYSPPVFHRFHEHFNTSLGKVLNSKRDFKTSLYEAQEQATERLGWQQHFREAEPKRVNDDGMDVTHDARKAQGMST